MGKLDKLKAEYPEINVSTDNSVASEADMVIIAVKPWKKRRSPCPSRTKAQN